MRATLPPSASGFLVNLAGGAAFLGAVHFCQTLWPGELVPLSVGGIAAAIAVLLLGEICFLKVHRRDRVGLREGEARNWPRLALKALALNVTMALVIAGYFLVPEYEKSYYTEFRDVLSIAIPTAFVTGNLYLFFFDHRLGSPDDGLLYFGYLLTGRWKRGEDSKIADYLKSALLRAYFVPAMYIYLIASLETYIGGADHYLTDNASHLADIPGARIVMGMMLVYFFLMVIDGLFAVIGYLMTFKALDSDVRTTEPTFIGWVTCILCYTPFFEVLLVSWLLRDLYYNPQWFVWFESSPALLIPWGCLTVAAMCAEAFTTMTFGIRFSNLTYRGLISNGLFRYTKHPQYVSKLFNRFFVFVPFLSPQGLYGAAWTLFLFALICLLYYVRARTEENHLSIHDDYVRYAELMNERSVFRALSRLLPFLVYSREKALAGKLF